LVTGGAAGFFLELMLFIGFKYTRSKKFSQKKQKGFRDGLSYSTPQKSEETRGNAITQPRPHPIKKM